MYLCTDSIREMFDRIGVAVMSVSVNCEHQCVMMGTSDSISVMVKDYLCVDSITLMLLVPSV